MPIMKAQIQNQVFIYIMAALIMGLAVYFGAKGILQISDTASNAAILKFKKDISELIDGLTYGNEREYTPNVPAGYALCFINETTDSASYQYLSEAFSSTGNQVFLVNLKDKVPEPISVDKEISVQNGPLCIKEPQKLHFSFYGESVLVSK